MGMTVLITNNTLASRAGTELYVRDLAFGLLARGHTPVAFSTVLGDVAEELRRGSVRVIDDIAALDIGPDLIHGHHHLETTVASLRFPRAPVISFCHGWSPWEELPARLPTVARYVAVDRVCLERLVLECGIPPADVSLLYNFVDLKRFSSRGALPGRPRRALVFSNAASEQTHLPPIREACAVRGIAVDAAGSATQPLERPEAVLGGYDLVFAKARAAMEAMATGCAVVLCDQGGAGPLVTSGDFERLRELNFGIRTLRRPVTAERVGEEIDRFDAADAARVHVLMRGAGDLERRLDELLELYDAVLAAPRPEPDLAALSAAAASYLQWLSPRIKALERARQEVRVLDARLEVERQALAQNRLQVGELSALLDSLAREPGLRLQLAVNRLPGVGGLARALRRRFFAREAPPAR